MAVAVIGALAVNGSRGLEAEIQLQDNISAKFVSLRRNLSFVEMYPFPGSGHSGRKGQGTHQVPFETVRFNQTAVTAARKTRLFIGTMNTLMSSTNRQPPKFGQSAGREPLWVVQGLALRPQSAEELREHLALGCTKEKLSFFIAFTAATKA